MSPLKVSDPTEPGGERISKTKVTGFITSVIAAWRLAESMFAFHILPADIESKVGPFVDLAFMVGGFVVILFRGKKG